MAEISKVNDVAWDDIAAVAGVAKASVAGIEGMTVPSGGIPASITASANLVHWYKMNEGSTSAVTDFGLSAASTDMTLLGASSETGGPTAIGTPDVVKFNGTTGVGSVYVRSGGTNTSLGTLFNTNTFTVAWWMKDLSASYGNYAHWLACIGQSGVWPLWPWIDGWGVQYQWYQIAPWEGAITIYGAGTSFSGAGVWRHYAVRFDPTAGWVPGQYHFFLNGTQVGSTDQSINTSIGTFDPNIWFSVGAIKQSGTLGTGSYTAPYMSDLRFYDTVLSDANVASIYAGDWT